MFDGEKTCVCDGHYNSDIESDYNDDDLGYNDLYEPWRNIVISIKTATGNISKHQNQLRCEHKPLITNENIAKSLARRGVLRNVITVQISSNRNFV